MITSFVGKCALRLQLNKFFFTKTIQFEEPVDVNI